MQATGQRLGICFATFLRVGPSATGTLPSKLARSLERSATSTQQRECSGDSRTPPCPPHHARLVSNPSASAARPSRVLPSAPANSRRHCSGSHGDWSQTRRPRVGEDEEETEEAKVPFYDIVIAGGGMAGRAMACALGVEASLDAYKILVIEGGGRPLPLAKELDEDSYSNRVCAVSQSSVDLLSSVGAWSRMVDHRVQPVRSMQVWDACSDAAIAFRDGQEAGQDLAYIVENRVTVDALSRRLGEMGGRVKVQYNNSVAGLKVPDQTQVSQESWARVELADGKAVKTRLLIGADGANSVVRRLCNVPYVQWKYNQSAVVATLQLSEETDNVVAWQRFLPTGPIAMLPLTNRLSSLVWSTSPGQAERLLQMTEEQFVDEVNNAFWDDSHTNQAAITAGQLLNSVLSAVKPRGSAVRQLPPGVFSVSPGSRAAFPLSLGHASHYVQPRVALIGDAAHRVHPLAGQGVNLGFGDVACLRDTLVSAATQGQDIGGQSHLLEYETSRQREVVPVLGVIDGLKRLYSTANPAIVLARSLGLQATNAMEPLKQQIIRLATGR